MNKFLLGIEWSETNPKLACFKAKGSKYELYRLEELTIPRQTDKDIVQTLADWIKTYIPKGSQVYTTLALPESLIFLKEIELPKIKDQEIDEAILWETPTFTPLSPSEIVIQWKKIAETEKSLQVSVVAVKNQDVERLVSLFNEVNITIQAIEPTSLALVRLLPLEASKITLLVSAGIDETNFIVIKNGSPIFSNSLPITLAGMKTNKEKLAGNIADSLANSVREVINFLEQRKESTVQQVIIAGDVVNYSGLASTINSLIHLPTIWGKFLSFDSVLPIPGSKQTISRYLVVLGAALRPAVGTERVNLLPYSQRKIIDKEEQQAGLAKKILTFSKISIVFLIFLLILSGACELWKNSLVLEVNQATEQNNNHPAQKLIKEIASTNLVIYQVNYLLAKQKDYGEKLRYFSSLVPVNIHLTDLTVTTTDKDEWKISGIGDRDAILAFYQKLVSASGAKEVSMPYSNLQKEKEADFKITILW